MKRALVMGAGFEGLATAYYLQNTYGLDVTIIDAAPKIGGVMRGMRHGDFHLDFGCQVFDNFDARVTKAITNLADHKYEFDTVSYASRFAGKVATEVSVPDLTGLPAETLAAIQSETIASKEDGLSADTLAEYSARRWGSKAAGFINTINRKALDDDASQLDQSSRIFAGLSRLRLFDDDAYAYDLKSKNVILDAKVAVPRKFAAFYSDAQTDPSAQNIIPLPHSFGGFCTTAEDVLIRNGVTFHLGANIESLSIEGDNGAVSATYNLNDTLNETQADLLVWCADFERLCTALGHPSGSGDFLDPIGTTLTYFKAPALNLSEHGYFQNYDLDTRFFRFSSMGNYTRQITTDGLSFCCVETPSKTSPDKDDPETEAMRDWEDLRSLGLVTGDPFGTTLRRFVPNCIKRRRPGYTKATTVAEENLALQFGRSFVYQSPDSFGRTPTARQLFDKIDDLLS